MLRILLSVIFLLHFASDSVAHSAPQVFESDHKKQNLVIKIHQLAAADKWNDASRLAIQSGDHSIMLFVKILKEITIVPGVMYNEDKLCRLLNLTNTTEYKNGNTEASMSPVDYSARKIIDDYNKIQPKDRESAIKKVRKTWRNRTFTRTEEDLFYGRFKANITQEDNNARMDNLLWSNQVEAAQRMLPRIGGEQKHILRARLSIKTASNYGEVKKIISKLSAANAKNQSVAYEHVLWMHNTQSMYKNVVEFLIKAPAPNDHKYSWWLISRYYIRDFLASGSTQKMHKVAYILATRYKPLSGPDAADAEWLAGWIALRFLNTPSKAYKHFVDLYDNANAVNTLSRAAYWAGMASQEMHYKQYAQKWYSIAARYPTTFYGQIALITLDKRAQINFSLPSVNKHTISELAQTPVAQMLYYACIVNNPKLVENILRVGINNINNINALEAFVSIPKHFGMSYLSIYGAHFASLQKKATLVGAGYPIEYANLTTIDVPLCLAIIRKESQFNRMAKSSVGATGLMQVKPEAGKHIANKLRVDFLPNKLFEPKYNIYLGSNYMQNLLNSNGNLVMSLVAYNAGYSRLTKIVEAYGDPRKIKNLNEILDWIELIPYAETREYVHRVIESLQVYRSLLKNGSQPTKLMIAQDLQGRYVY